MSKRARKQSKSNIEYKPQVEEKNLLLSYTYFLSVKKTISVGFHPSSLKAAVLLREYGTNNGLYLTREEWKCLNLLIQPINNFIFEVDRKETEELLGIKSESEKSVRGSSYIISKNISLKLKYGDSEPVIYLRGTGTSVLIKFTLDEWKKCTVTFSNFIFTELENNHVKEDIIQKYFDLYIAKCVELKVNFIHANDYLKSSWILETSGLQDEIYFNRLFFELPIFCKDQLLAKTPIIIEEEENGETYFNNIFNFM